MKPQKLQQPDEDDFKKLNFAEEEKQFFHVEYHYQREIGIFIKRYVFNEPWRFVLRVRPNMIDKVKRVLKVVISKFIEQSSL